MKWCYAIELRIKSEVVNYQLDWPTWLEDERPNLQGRKMRDWKMQGWKMWDQFHVMIWIEKNAVILYWSVMIILSLL